MPSLSSLRNRHMHRQGANKRSSPASSGRNITNSCRTTLYVAAAILLLGLAGPVLLASASATTGAGDTEGGAVIGIDLGTTFSVVGVYRGGMGSGASVDIIPNDQGNRITPSYVSWTDTGERLIGDAAKNQASSNPKATVYDAKRLIGREFSDPSVQRDAKTLPFDVVDAGSGRTAIRMPTTTAIDPDTGLEVRVNSTFAPEEISAMVLGRMKEIAEAQLGEEVTGAVVTVPAYFNDAQRQATVDAGRIAGLNVMRIINEPTAAAIAYGLENVPAGQDEKNILVFDLGGGTFDVSLLTIDGDTGVFEVLATAGDTHLGGEDFDQRLMAFLVKSFAAKNKDLSDADIKDMKNDARALQRLRSEAERVKRVLSSQHSTQAELESLWRGRDLDLTVTRARFEEMNADLFAKTVKPVEKVLKDSGLDTSEVDEIVLVGGSTRIPKVQQLIKEYFDGKEPSRGINPDEAVAFGASIQAAQIAGRIKGGIVVLDTTALSMGIETAGGIMSTIVPSGTTFPAKKSQIFSTVSDNQPAVGIQVYQGERAMAKDNHMLGHFELTGIPPAPRGVPQIEVVFEVDVDGITHVTARDTASGNSKSIVINSDTRSLSDEEIRRMQEEAERFRDADAAVREKVVARTQLEAYLYSLKNMLDENEDALQDEALRELGEAVDDAIEWLEDNGETAGKDELQEKRSEIESIANPIVRDMYGRGGGGFDDEEEEEDQGDGFEWDDI